MKTIINNVLTDAYVDKVKELFEYKHWNKDTNMRSEFDRFCKRLADLDDDNQRDLVLELSKDYLKFVPFILCPSSCPSDKKYSSLKGIGQF